MRTFEEYKAASEVLWGPAAAWVYDEYQRHNLSYFDGALPPLPIVIGLTAYGHCNALTRGCGEWGHNPRISLASWYFDQGTVRLSDTLIHEMVHVHLMLKGVSPEHKDRPWCEEIVRITPLLLGTTIQAKPVYPRRINGTKQRVPYPGHLKMCEIAQWPHTLRDPKGGRGQILKVATY